MHIYMVIETFVDLISCSTVRTLNVIRRSALADSCGGRSVFVGISFGMDQLDGRDTSSSVQQQPGASSFQRVLCFLFLHFFYITVT